MHFNFFEEHGSLTQLGIELLLTTNKLYFFHLELLSGEFGGIIELIVDLMELILCRLYDLFSLSSLYTSLILSFFEAVDCLVIIFPHKLPDPFLIPKVFFVEISNIHFLLSVKPYGLFFFGDLAGVNCLDHFELLQ